MKEKGGPAPGPPFSYLIQFGRQVEIRASVGKLRTKALGRFRSKICKVASPRDILDFTVELVWEFGFASKSAAAGMLWECL